MTQKWPIFVSSPVGLRSFSNEQEQKRGSQTMKQKWPIFVSSPVGLLSFSSEREQREAARQ